MRGTLRRWLGGVLILLVVPLAAHAITIDKAYVFGDSLSDQGNDFALTAGAIPPPEYSDGTVFGRFTNGRNYVDYFAQRMGISITPSLLGGTNYAYGGARTSYRAPTSPFALSLVEQRDAFLSALGGARADGNALYIVWAGSNDLGDIVGRIAGDPLYDPTADLTTTLTDLSNVIASLAASGARHFLVPNIPDLGLVPAITGGGAPNPLVSGLVMSFNLALEAALSGLETALVDLDLRRLDSFALLNEAYTDPASFGFSNVSDACYSLYVRPGGTTCAAPSEYVFWDAEHPSSATHRQLGLSVPFSVAEPGSGTLLLVAAGIAGAVRGRARRQSRFQTAALD